MPNKLWLICTINFPRSWSDHKTKQLETLTTSLRCFTSITAITTQPFWQTAQKRDEVDWVALGGSSSTTRTNVNPCCITRNGFHLHIWPINTFESGQANTWPGTLDWLTEEQRKRSFLPLDLNMRHFSHTLPSHSPKPGFSLKLLLLFFLNLAQVPEKDNLIYVATQKVEDKNVLVTIYNWPIFCHE